MDKIPGKDVVATGRLYSDVLKGDPSPTWLRRYQEEDEEEAVKRAIKESVKSSHKDSCTDSSDDNLLQETGGFSSVTVKNKGNAVFESWEEEDFLPGVPVLPLTSYRYRNVGDVSESGKCKRERKELLSTKKKRRGKDEEGSRVVIDLTCDSPEKRKKNNELRHSSSKEEISGYLQESSGTDEDEDNDFLGNNVRKKQRKFHPDLWGKAPVQEVSTLPCGIDGLAVYNMAAGNDQQAVLLSDGRKWKKSTVTEWKRYGPMRYADCQGSFKCTNESCPFRVEFGVVNRTQVNKDKDGTTTCGICGRKTEYVPCPGRRYVRKGKKSIKVFHWGNHTCPVISKPEKPTTKIREMLEENPKLTPSEIQSSFIMASLRKGGDWNEVEKAANRLVDKKWIANEKENIKRETRPYGENFEAVVTFKLYCDNQDELLIHKVNDRRGNPDFPSFVFKTSKERMKIALNMDREGEHFMREEYCYFDGKVKRCRNFVTLTASTYHPILKKQIPLAIMETEKEDSENIELFWTLFNTSIKKAAGDNTVFFNPTGWCTDMAGANMNGIERVFGKDALSRIKSCEFHFKESRNKMARKLGGTVGDEFKDLCQNLLESNLQESYLVAKDALEEFIDENSDRQFLKSWLTWWDSRRCFIFSAFSPKCGPKMNLAEVVHAGWANRDNRNLSLLDVAQIDVKDSVLLKAELKAIEQGSSKPVGRGPAFHEKRARDHRRELQKAVQLGKEVGSLAAGLEVDPQSGYFPPEDKPKRGRKRTKNCNPQKKSTARSEYSDPILTEKFSTTLSRPPTLSQPRGSELQLQAENGQLLSQGQSSQPLSQEQNSRLLSQGQSSQLLLQAQNSQLLSQVASSQSLSQAHTSQVLPQVPSSQSLSQVQTSQPMLPQINQLLRMPQPESQRFCQLPRQPLLHTCTATSQASQSTPVVNYAGIHPYHPVQTHPLGGNWHSGFSPHKYEIMELPQKVKKCYGCGSDFVEKHRHSPHNIIVRHCDRRLMRRDERTGQFQYSADYSNTYYHFDVSHIRRKNPLYDGKVYIDFVKYQTMESEQRDVIRQSNFEVILLH